MRKRCVWVCVCVFGGGGMSQSVEGLWIVETHLKGGQRPSKTKKRRQIHNLRSVITHARTRDGGERRGEAVLHGHRGGLEGEDLRDAARVDEVDVHLVEGWWCVCRGGDVCVCVLGGWDGGWKKGEKGGATLLLGASVGIIPGAASRCGSRASRARACTTAAPPPPHGRTPGG